MASSGGACAGAEAGLRAALAAAGAGDAALRPTALVFAGHTRYAAVACNETRAWDGSVAQVRTTTPGLSSQGSCETMARQIRAWMPCRR